MGRSLVCQLEELDLRQMKHEEKLAFWINVHNALVMHVKLWKYLFINTWFIPSVDFSLSL